MPTDMIYALYLSVAYHTIYFGRPELQNLTYFLYSQNWWIFTQFVGYILLICTYRHR